MSNRSLPEGTHTVEIVFADIFGLLRGKKVPIAFWEDVQRTGVRFANPPQYWGVRCDIADDNLSGSDIITPDIVVIPDPDAPIRAIPWRPGIAQVQGLVYDEAGELSLRCPRNAMIRMVDEYKAMNITPNIALELEFSLLNPETKQPYSDYINCYGMFDSSPNDAILADITQTLVEYGLPVESAMQEYARGQMEITLRYDEVVKAADDAILMRHAVKQLAAKHGAVATYMSKPFDDQSGNGLHVHHSLWSEGQPLFVLDEEGSGLAPIARNFLGGLQAHIGDFSLLGSWSTNDYKRRVPGAFSPTTEAWGGDNRTVAIREIKGGGSYRYEQRDASPGSNLYLTVAGHLAAGLDGIKNQLEPAAKCEVEADTDPAAVYLPRTVPAAIERFKGSRLAREMFSDTLVDTYIETIEYEYELVTKPVNHLERERYIGAL